MSIKCPKCNSEKVELFDCKENGLNLDDLKGGFVRAYYDCEDCEAYFEVRIRFTAEVTDMKITVM